MRCKCNKDLHNIFEACLVQVVFSEGLKTVSTTHVAEGIFIWKLVASLVAAQRRDGKIIFSSIKVVFSVVIAKAERCPGVLSTWLQ